jgi:Tfp pilus assembly protein PilP
MMSRIPIGAALLSLLVSLVPSCGEDPPPTPMPQVGRRSAATPAARAPSARTAEVTGDSVVRRRELPPRSHDPFQREVPEGEAPLLGASEVALEPEQAVDLGPLAEYPLESLRLQAIITRTPEPRAMFLVPDGSGLAVLARVDDIVGPNGTGRIIDIQPNRVIVAYEARFEFGRPGEEMRTQEVHLRDPARDIAADFVPY